MGAPMQTKSNFCSYGTELAILENSTAQAEDMFGFGDSFVNGPSDNNREGAGLFARRRGKSRLYYLTLQCSRSFR